jgi:hypothetical protein
MEIIMKSNTNTYTTKELADSLGKLGITSLINSNFSLPRKHQSQVIAVEQMIPKVVALTEENLNKHNGAATEETLSSTPLTTLIQTERTLRPLTSNFTSRFQGTIQGLRASALDKFTNQYNSSNNVQTHEPFTKMADLNEQKTHSPLNKTGEYTFGNIGNDYDSKKGTKRSQTPYEGQESTPHETSWKQRIILSTNQERQTGLTINPSL